MVAGASVETRLAKLEVIRDEHIVMRRTMTEDITRIGSQITELEVRVSSLAATINATFTSQSKELDRLQDAVKSMPVKCLMATIAVLTLIVGIVSAIAAWAGVLS